MSKRIIGPKSILVIISVFLFTIFVVLEVRAEKTRCMGIPFISEEELAKAALQQVELGNIICLGEHLVPYNEKENIIYLPCNVTPETMLYEIEGQLKSSLPKYRLYFFEESFWEILSEAMKYNYLFSLYAISESGEYAFYNVAFTTLPIVELHGEINRIDEEEREVYSGVMTVWEPANQEINRMNVQTSNLEWNIRGNSSKAFLKKSYKLSLKQKNGENNQLSMLGFESDDDYLLNAMYFDDVKVREKLAMSLWNEIQEEKNEKSYMSNGEYCELIINGEYLGLRLMQNRLDKKSLKLNADDMLLKGKNAGKGKGPENVYEVIYAKDTEKAYRAMDDFFEQKDFGNVNIDNWVDLTLFLEFGNMVDNHKYKNIYYLIKKDDNGEKLSLIPWDTDMSFGVYWSGGFTYLPDSVEKITHRMEYDALLKQYPEVKTRLFERWNMLRKTVFSEKNIYEKIDTYYNFLYISGALKRDHQVLGWYPWSGEDTLENLYSYIERRLEILDQRYSKGILQ